MFLKIVGSVVICRYVKEHFFDLLNNYIRHVWASYKLSLQLCEMFFGEAKKTFLNIL